MKMLCPHARIKNKVIFFFIFTLSTYNIITYNQAIPESIESIVEHPIDPTSLLIQYGKGDLKRGTNTSVLKNDISLMSVIETTIRAAKIHLPMQFDIAAPPTLRGIIHTLPSLPSYHRIPYESLSNTSAYFSTWNSSTSPALLFMYNPSIVALPSSIIANLAIADKVATTNSPKYLSSYRISSKTGCTHNVWKHDYNVFGFAYLDENLDMIPGSDIVVDLNKFFTQYNGRSKKSNMVNFEDLRLFVLHGTVYISHSSNLVPIGISMHDPNTQIREQNEEEDRELLKRQPSAGSAALIPNMYGSGIQLFLSGNMLKVDREGKNFQFFEIPECLPGNNVICTERNLPRMRKNHTILMEDWVSGPRIMVQYNLGLSTNAIRKTWKVQKLEPMKDFKSDHLPESVTIPNHKEWKSYGAKSERVISLKRDRATACCVRIDNIYFRDLVLSGIKQNTTDQKWLGEDGYVLVGVAHVKKRNKFGSWHYLSRLYAFSPYPPYEILARSGLMCFGLGNESATNVNDDPYAAIVSKTHDFGFTKKEFHCPRIHYVSGIVEKVGDPSKLILAYGVDDCISRMVEINKIDFVEHLFTVPVRRD